MIIVILLFYQLFVLSINKTSYCLFCQFIYSTILDRLVSSVVRLLGEMVVCLSVCRWIGGWVGRSVGGRSVGGLSPAYILTISSRFTVGAPIN